MAFLDNFEEYLLREEAGNGEIIQDELPIELEKRLSLEQIERYKERLKYMEDYGI